MAGTLRLAKPLVSFASLATAFAYVSLLIYTAALMMLAVRTFIIHESSLVAWLSAGPAFAGYPIAYIAAEWIFYYGFRRPARGAG